MFAVCALLDLKPEDLGGALIANVTTLRGYFIYDIFLASVFGWLVIYIEIVYLSKNSHIAATVFHLLVCIIVSSAFVS